MSAQANYTLGGKTEKILSALHKATALRVEVTSMLDECLGEDLSEVMQKIPEWQHFAKCEETLREFLSAHISDSVNDLVVCGKEGGEI
jgi:hypothetical protein